MLRKLLPSRGSYFLRAVDKALGVPAVFSMGLFRKQKTLPSPPPKTIAILLSAAIGDSVLFLSIVQALKKKFPLSQITAFVGESNQEFVEDYFGTTVIPIQIFNPLLAIQEIRKAGSFDVWIDTGQWQRITALYTHFAHASWKIGFRSEGQGRHFAYDWQVPHLRTVHEIENYRNLVRDLGVLEFEPPRLPRLNKSDPKRIVIHAFAGGSKPYLKEWPEEYWVETINSLLKEGNQISLTGTLRDKERAENIRSQTLHPEKVKVVAGLYSLKETIGELERASCVISVNTGILHVAAALGVYTIGLHGPTSALRWGPVGEKVLGLQSPRHCSPCLHFGFDYGCPRNDCMKDLRPEKVLQNLTHLANR